jgi:glycosyltransferase involved in cell wall biosynthesis
MVTYSPAQLNSDITGTDSVSILIPAYNEVDKLKQNILSIKEAINAISASYQIIITEDGTTDGTAIIAKKLAEENSCIYHVHSNERGGKGFALRKAIKVSEGDLVLFMDADLATSLDCLSKILGEVKNGFDVAIGSRNRKGA